MQSVQSTQVLQLSFFSSLLVHAVCAEYTGIAVITLLIYTLFQAVGSVQSLGPPVKRARFERTFPTPEESVFSLLKM